MDIRITNVSPTSPILSEVISLWGDNRKTLGLFPAGAFKDYAEKGYVLAAIDKRGKVAGYLVYRITNNLVTVVHLCVSQSCRGNHIGKKLFEYLIKNTEYLFGVRVNCRSDYDENKVWQKFRMVPVKEKLGRGKEGKWLTCWWLDNGHPDLFSMDFKANSNLKIVAAIDANVFFDLVGPKRPEGEESRALQAGWLKNDLTLCVTNEIYNEINRQEDISKREKHRSKVNRFGRLVFSLNESIKIENRLLQLWPEQLSEQDISDIRQVVGAIASKCPYFVTRDNDILAKRDSIEDAYNITICRPSDLVIIVDKIKKEAKYQSESLAATQLMISKLDCNQEDNIAKQFQATEKGEKRGVFRAKLRQYLANPDDFEVMIISDAEDNQLALLGFSWTNDQKLEIGIMRIKRGILSIILNRYLVQHALFAARDRGINGVFCSEKYLGKEAIAAFEDAYFLRMENGNWRKELVDGVCSVFDLLETIKNRSNHSKFLKKYYSDIEMLAKKGWYNGIYSKYVLIEDRLWPLKLNDANIPCYIVPIEPRWALHLIDPDLAKQTLFGAAKELALRCEGVYYRSAKVFPRIKAPSCVLWYVSQDKRYNGTSAIRAYSRIEQVVIGGPKELFPKFNRLGVFLWRHVYRKANYDINNKIQAIRFSSTEPFKKPIGRKEMLKILHSVDIKTQLQSPIKVPRNILVKLYSIGLGM